MLLSLSVQPTSDRSNRRPCSLFLQVSASLKLQEKEEARRDMVSRSLRASLISDSTLRLNSDLCSFRSGTS